jgi:hypothetical protein
VPSRITTEAAWDGKNREWGHITFFPSHIATLLILYGVSREADVSWWCNAVLPLPCSPPPFSHPLTQPLSTPCSQPLTEVTVLTSPLPPPPPNSVVTPLTIVYRDRSMCPGGAVVRSNS